MNLITDPWIPVVCDNGEALHVGLEQLFRKAAAIRDLSVNPPQRIALMRLLLCITQAALDGPEDEADWQACRPRIIPETLAYLASRHDRFELYGDRPFLQCSNISSDNEASLDKLFETSKGENPMFLGARASDGAVFTDADKALALLVFLNFSATGRIGQSIWCDIKNSDSTFAAPCFTNLFLFIRGECMIDTLWMNIIPRNLISYVWGQPVWDDPPIQPNDLQSFQNAFTTYLGRTVPFTRLIKLPHDQLTGTCVIGPVPKKQVYSNDLHEFRESYLTVRLSNNGEHYYMKVNTSKHLWRELSSLLALNVNQEGFCALNLHNLNQAVVECLDIWCGGLAKGAQAAKIHDFAEWNFTLPVSLLGEAPLKKYSEGVAVANDGEFTLKKAVQAYAKAMKAESGGFSRRATNHYWSTLDSNYQELVEIASDQDRDLDGWRKLLYRTLCAAFDLACPHETPRQIQAYAQAKKLLKVQSQK